MRRRAVVDTDKLVRCVASHTWPALAPRSDQYLLPDGRFLELRRSDSWSGPEDGFTRHHDVKQCYWEQYNERYPHGAFEEPVELMTHLPEIDFPGDNDVVADFMDRTGAIRVAQVSDLKDEYEVSLESLPSPEQMDYLRSRCTREHMCGVDLTNYSPEVDNATHYAYVGNFDMYVPGGFQPIQRAICRGLNESGERLYQLNPEASKRMLDWARGNCRG